MSDELETGQKVKASAQTTEAAGGSQTDSDTQDLQRCNDPPEDIDSPSGLVSADSRSTMQHPLTDNDDYDLFWLSALMGNEGRGSQSGSTSSICACGSSVITPGNHPASHHDYFSADGAPRRRQSQYKISTSSTSPRPSSFPGFHANCNLSHSTTCGKNSSGSTFPMDATFLNPFPQSQSQMHPAPHLSPISELHSVPSAAAQPDPLRGEDELAAAELGFVEATDVTRRLAIVLEAIRTAGFQDFDETAAAYYTARLDKGSFPAMVQSASRGRRLKTMLQTVQRSSQKWLRWESRGLQESICEGSATLCVVEINRFSNRSVQDSDENELAPLITALESLLSSHKGGIFGQTSNRSLAPLEASGLLEQMENAPDSMPFLWSLLTELAGTRNLYCDRVARLILTILLYSRSA